MTLRTIIFARIAWLAILVAPLVRAETIVQVVGQSSEAGFTVAVPIQLDSDQNVVGLQFDLTYDPMKLAIGEPELEAGLDGVVLSSRRIIPGKRRVLVYSDELAVLPNSILLTVPGTLPPGVTGPQVSLTLADAVASDGAGESITPLSLLSGVIVVEDGDLVSFDSVDVLADGTAMLTFTGVSGKLVTLEFSTNLDSWEQIAELEIEDGEIVEVEDPEGLREKGFYRVRVVTP